MTSLRRRGLSKVLKKIRDSVKWLNEGSSFQTKETANEKALGRKQLEGSNCSKEVSMMGVK